MFNFFKKSKKESSKENLEDSFKIQDCLLSSEELETIQKFELEWKKRSSDSKYVEIPTIGNFGKNGIVKNLISDRGIFSIDPHNERRYVFNEDSLKEEMLMVEQSLIDKFLFENPKSFIKGDRLSDFLSENELKQEFTSGLSSSDTFKIYDNCDFISIDKKIISINKDLYYLDWKSKKYFGNIIGDMGEYWENQRDEIFNTKSWIFNQLFRLPKSVTYDNISEFYDDVYSVRIDSYTELELFPTKWSKDSFFINSFNSLISFGFRNRLIKRTKELYKSIEHEKNKNKELKIKKVEKIKKEVLFDLDKNNNQKLDVLESNGYYELLELMKKELQEKGEEYIHHLVKLKKFINDKGDNLNSIYNLLKSVETKEDLTFYKGVLNNEINIYQKLIFHSMSMITFLDEGDKFSFYEIYELFDELNVFDSKWEKDLSFKLTDINNSVEKTNNLLKEKFDELNTTIYNNSVETNKKLDKLTYTTQNSINSLTSTMNIRLKSINSSIDTNNLLTLINTYQTYKVNKNTKTLKN